MSVVMETKEISAKCRQCGKIETTKVLRSDLIRYDQGEYIQVAFPEATPDQRELILQSGPHGFFIGSKCGCWDEMFPVEEEEGL